MNSYGIPSYYVIKMFSTHRGDNIVKVDASGPFDPLFWVAVRDSVTGKIYVKAANWDSIPWDVTFNVSGFTVGSIGYAQILSGSDVNAINLFSQPTLLSPVASSFPAGKIFTFTFPANSVTVFEISTK